MPRVLVEAEVQAEFGPLRIMTTHLEYYSRTHRAAQIARISELRAQQIAPRKRVGDPGPFEWQPGAEGALLCGDFNLPPDDALHRAVLDIGFVDAWQALHPGEPHPFTFRVHQREAGQSPYCCDFVFVTPDLVPRLRSIHVDSQNRSSDHQPVIIELR